jgi:hypothetical protein
LGTLDILPKTPGDRQRYLVPPPVACGWSFTSDDDGGRQFIQAGPASLLLKGFAFIGLLFAVYIGNTFRERYAT